MKSQFALITLVGCILFVWVACKNEKNTSEQDKSQEQYKQFLTLFDTLVLPHKFESSDSNYVFFTDLLKENVAIDNDTRQQLKLDTTTLEYLFANDSIKEKVDSIYTFFAVGKVFSNPNFDILLYARNTAHPLDDLHIFLRTCDKKGNKLDEMLFHRPTLHFPSNEVNRVSEILNDSTLRVFKTLNQTHNIKNAKGTMQPEQEQSIDEKHYVIRTNGKIEEKK